MISLKHALLLAAYAVGMSAGQVLFKIAANRLSGSGPGTGLAAVLRAPEIYIGVALYAVLTVFWVWLLSFIPLSRAYPTVALTVVLTPALGVLLFTEPMSLNLVIGLGLITAGLIVVWA